MNGQMHSETNSTCDGLLIIKLIELNCFAKNMEKKVEGKTLMKIFRHKGKTKQS